MCGIFGVFSSLKNGFSQKQMDVLGQNIIINQFRGTDSTGMFLIDRQDKSHMLKVLGGASALFSNDAWEDFKQKISFQAKAVVGHGRSATRGTVKLENAHPFAKSFPSGEVLKLVHNGTLDYGQDLPDFNKFDVDSEWIAEMLVRYGPEEALSQIRGAMALVWWNEKDKTINFFRNSERPLHFGTFEGGGDKTLIINSEAPAVRYLAARNGLKTTKKEDVYYFSEYTHYSLDANDLFGDWKAVTKIEKPKVKVYSAPITYGSGYSETPEDRRRRMALMCGWGHLDDDDVPDFWGRPRTYENDLDALKCDLYKVIEFFQDGSNGWKRRTQAVNWSVMVEPVPNPYVLNLVRMERLWADIGKTGFKPWVRLTYFNKESQAHTYTHIGVPDDPVDRLTKATVPAVPPPVLPISPAGAEFDGTWNWKDENYYKDFVDVVCRKLSPGRKIRWTNRSGSQVVRHNATIGDSGGCELKRYENNYDGAFVPGDEILMEVATMEEAEINGKNYFCVEGARLKSVQDRAVDVCFFIESGTGDEKLFDVPDNEIPFMKGTIERIELATRTRHSDSGAYVVLVLKDVKVATDSAKKEDDNDETTQAAA